MKVFNIYYKLIYEFKPEKYNHNILPLTLYLLVHNNHCWKLNNEIESLAHQKIILDEKIVKTKKVYQNFIFRDFEQEKKIIKSFFYNIKQMNEFIENNPDKNIQFLTNNNLDDMIIEFIDNKYFPSVKIKNDMINSIHIRCNKNLYSIKNPDNCDNIDTINTIDEENLIVYDKADRYIYMNGF